MEPLDILVCDDEQSICLLLEDVLTRFGHRVVTCQDGATAIAHAKEHEFDLAFLDLRMPGMGGEEVLKRVRELRPEARFVMITGYARDDVVEEALKSGAIACLGKPFSLTQVVKLLDQIGSEQPVGV